MGGVATYDVPGALLAMIVVLVDVGRRGRRRGERLDGSRGRVGRESTVSMGGVASVEVPGVLITRVDVSRSA